jgi:hypothetical protein
LGDVGASGAGSIVMGDHATLTLDAATGATTRIEVAFMEAAFMEFVFMEVAFTEVAVPE